MDKKTVILAIFIILSVSYVYAISPTFKTGLFLDTVLSKNDGQETNVREFTIGDKLVWKYYLINSGPSFTANVCLYIKRLSDNKIFDITREPVLRELNSQRHNCDIGTDKNENPCPIKLESIGIGGIDNTNDNRFYSTEGKIFDFTFPGSFPDGNYQLIAQLRETTIKCSNPDGSIIPASPGAGLIAETANDFKYTLTTTALSNLPCPNVGPENPSILGCLSGSFIPSNAVEKQGYGCTPEALTGTNRKCYECPTGFIVKDSGTFFASCIAIGTVRDNPVPAPHDERECVDGDGGYEPDIKGTIRTYYFGNELNYEDRCINDLDLEEFLCTNGEKVSLRIECEVSCKEGHCSQEKDICPITGPENQRSVGCRSSAIESSTVDQRHICTESAKNCYKCIDGYVFNRETNRCISLTDPAFRLPESCISLKDDLPRDTKLKIVIVGDKYGTDNNLFLRDANAIKDQILSFEPFRESSSKINFYAINPNQDLGCRFDCLPNPNQPSLPCCTDDFRLIRRLLAQNCPYNEIIVVINEGGYASGISALGWTILASGSIRTNVIIHEFGHSFGGLSDEYLGDIEIGDNEVPRGINCDNNPQCTKWQDITNSEEGRRRRVGCFEGCTQIRRFYRPIQEHSIMLDLSGDLGPVNERRLRRLLESYT